MDRQETMKILSVLRGAYPAFYRDTSRQEAEAIVNLWAAMQTRITRWLARL